MHGRKLNLNTVEEIRLLRSQGYSLPEISKQLGVPKTTVYKYSKQVLILPEFISGWEGKRGGSRKKKLFKEKKALEEGKKLVGVLTSKEKLLFLSALYWAEGSKGDFGLSNTDSDLVKVYVIILQDVFGITKDDLRVSIRIYEDLDKEKCLSFWSEVVGVPKERIVNINILPGKKKGKLEHGMCRIRVVKGGDFLKKIVGVNKAIVTSLTL